jgi:hypothetical protein
MIAKPTQSLADLYESDETAWLEEMAELIREGRLHDLDYPNLLEHLEAMALRDRKKVESRLAILIAHVLKWNYQPDKRTQSWRGTISEQQYRLAKIAGASVLRKHAASVFHDCYADAVKLAMNETKLVEETFPTECPWTLEQLLSPEVLEDGD